MYIADIPCTAWCSEIGSLTSLDAPELHASSDVREAILLHQAVERERERERDSDV